MNDKFMKSMVKMLSYTTFPTERVYTIEKRVKIQIYGHHRLDFICAFQAGAFGTVQRDC